MRRRCRDFRNPMFLLFSLFLSKKREGEDVEKLADSACRFASWIGWL